MKSESKQYIKADGKGNISAVLDNGKSQVELPLNKDGSIKWFDDSKLIKQEA